MELALGRVEETLLEYGIAFAALAEGQPSAFRTFLLKAPSMFIPIGEASGLGEALGLFALGAAFRDSKRWPGLKVAVSVRPCRAGTSHSTPSLPCSLGTPAASLPWFTPPAVLRRSTSWRTAA